MGKTKTAKPSVSKYSPKRTAAHPHGVGRPPKYDDRFPPMVKVMVAEPLFMTDEQIMSVLGISNASFYRWRHEHPEFREALLRSKEQVTAAIKAALARRAMGYSVDAVKIMTVPTVSIQTSKGKDGKRIRTVTKSVEIVSVPYLEHYPPDQGAISFYLTNVAPKEFKRGGIEDTSSPDSEADAIERAQRLDKFRRFLMENAEKGGPPVLSLPSPEDEDEDDHSPLNGANGANGSGSNGTNGAKKK